MSTDYKKELEAVEKMALNMSADARAIVSVQILILAELRDLRIAQDKHATLFRRVTTHSAIRTVGVL